MLDVSPFFVVFFLFQPFVDSWLILDLSISFSSFVWVVPDSLPGNPFSERSA